MAGKLALNSTHFTRGLVKYVPGRGYFRAVSFQNGDKFATSPTPPIVKRLDWPPVTAIPGADLPHCSPCVYITHKSAELRTENTGIDGMDLQDV